MAPPDVSNITAGPVDLDTLFSGLVRKSSEGKETIDYLSAVSAFGRCVAAGPDLPVLLHDACELAALVVHADTMVVATLSADGKSLFLKVASFDEKRKVVVRTADPISAAPDISMAAYTLQLADLVQTEDIVAERRFTDLLLRRLQVGSAVFVPLCSHNRAFGALGVARRKSGAFMPDENRFTVAIGQVLASHLAQRDAEEQFRRREAAVKATLDSVDSLILWLDAQGVVRQLNATGVRVSGFRTNELRDRPFWNTLIVPADADRVAAIFRRADRPGVIATFDAELLSKEGQPRAIRWSLDAINGDGDGDGDSARTYVLSGVDQTELREACRELEKYRKIAQGRAEQSADKADTSGTPQVPEGAEKRSSPRREYTYYQRIAPLLNDRIPGNEDFERVACHDISAGGFSFLADEAPPYDELVIWLGTPPQDRRVIAKVVRVVKKEIGGRSAHLVGCQFIGRISR